MPDALVIGAGPNGLVAANLLADAGWSVEVLEEQPVPGGAVRTAELTEPGFRSDLFSAFYPLAAASPALRGLELERHGLRFRHGPLVLAHPTLDGSCAILSRDLDATADALEADHAGDGLAWRRLAALWEQVGAHLLDAMCTPFPPVRAASRLAAALGPHDLARFARLAVLPVRRLADEEFGGSHAGRLLGGNALHADFSPESALGGLFGFVLCMLGQHVGYPFPEGGAGELSASLVRRLEARGGSVRCGVRAAEVLVRGGRAAGVRTADGESVPAGRAVLADVGAPQLFLELLAREHLPPRVLAAARRFAYDAATVKVDWALDGPIPWSAPDARRAPVVHVAEGLDELTVWASELARRLVPSRPFLVMGQYSMGDPTRCPPGKEVAWAYTHVPRGLGWGEAETEAAVAGIEQRVEELAPGFAGLVRSRHVLTPPRMEALNRNLSEGAINGGTAQLHQQLVFRPVPGLARPETPVRGLYLASASAHPGGGVHGAAGANAARAALNRERAKRATVALGAAALAATGTRALRARRP